MSMDFTVIQPVRQRFGGPGLDADPREIDLDAPFVGESKEYFFDCPNVDASQWAMLQFQSAGVEWPTDIPNDFKNILRINGVDIPGGLQPGSDRKVGSRFYHAWKTHTMLVPQGILREKGNVLLVEAPQVNIHIPFRDNFVIDNVVILYKTRGIVRPGGVINEEIIELAQ